MRYGAPLRRRRSRRRSLSERPPHIPNFSPFWRAYWRQSSRTTQPRQTSFASRVDPPLSGKKRSGSTPKQFAERCHFGGCVSKRSPVASAGRHKTRTMSVTGGSPRSWSRRSWSLGERCPQPLPPDHCCLIGHLGSTHVTTGYVTTLLLSSLITVKCARGDFNLGPVGPQRCRWPLHPPVQASSTQAWLSPRTLAPIAPVAWG